jgi:hypothetical protein
LTIKTTFKSHFKVNKNLKKQNKSKTIFIKNILIFFLFSKIFFKNCTVNVLFLKKSKNQTNLLKAPSRHKKFFHQIFLEFFFLKMTFKFLSCMKIHTNNLNPFFFKLNTFFSDFGTNLLNRTKFLIRIPIQSDFLHL